MRIRGCLRETPWQHSSAGPGGLWLMQTAPTGGYGEHMPGWDMQHPLIQQSISCPRAPAHLCWLLQEVAEPSLVLSLPLEARPAELLLSACPGPWASVHTPASARAAAQHESAQDQPWAWTGQLGMRWQDSLHSYRDGLTGSSSTKRTRHKH